MSTTLDASLVTPFLRWNYCSDIPLRVFLYNNGVFYNAYENDDTELRLVFFTDGARKYVCTRLYDEDSATMVCSGCEINEDGSITCNLDSPHFHPGRLHVKVYATEADETFDDGYITLCKFTCLPVLITAGEDDYADAKVQAALALPHTLIGFYEAAVNYGYTGDEDEFWAKILAMLDVEQIADLSEFDSTPTEGSTNGVTSGGVYTALEGKQDVLTPGDGISISEDGTISVTGGSSDDDDDTASTVIDSNTGKLKSSLATVVVLASMGATLDGNSDYTPSVGDTFYDEDEETISYVNANQEIYVGQSPRKSLIYCNAATGLFYRWDGSDWVALDTHHVEIDDEDLNVVLHSAVGAETEASVTLVAGLLEEVTELDFDNSAQSSTLISTWPYQSVSIVCTGVTQALCVRAPEGFYVSKDVPGVSNLPTEYVWYTADEITDSHPLLYVIPEGGSADGYEYPEQSLSGDLTVANCEVYHTISLEYTYTATSNE